MGFSLNTSNFQGGPVEEELKKCPYCGEEILKVAIKCKHCQSDLQANQQVRFQGRPKSDYGLVLLGIPVVSTMLIWFWVSSMNLLQSPDSSMALIMLFTVIGTAIVASMEASKFGMKSDRKDGTYSPISWFFIITLLWIIGYPVYLFKRRKYGLKNHLALGLMVAVVFIGSYGLMSAAIWQKKVEVRNSLQKIQNTFEPGNK